MGMERSPSEQSAFAGDDHGLGTGIGTSVSEKPGWRGYDHNRSPRATKAYAGQWKHATVRRYHSRSRVVQQIQYVFFFMTAQSTGHESHRKSLGANLYACSRRADKKVSDPKHQRWYA